MKIQTIISFFAAVLLAVMPVNVFAADADGNFIAKGLDNIGCSEVIKADQERGANFAMYGYWLLGYVSAVNKYHHDGEDIVTDKGNQAIYNRALLFCQNNPDSNWVAAAIHLIRYYKKQQ